jgi:pyruvate kinase
MDRQAAPSGLWDSKRLQDLIDKLSRIRLEMLDTERHFSAEIENLVFKHQDSARNLLHYLALRRHDLRPLQTSLTRFGLSSLGRSESRVLANLDAVLEVLAHLTGDQCLRSEHGHGDFVVGNSLLKKNTLALLGSKPKGRDVRIMVTMPSEAATDYGLIRNLVINGMDCMRINCAHDDEDAWSNMIENLRQAERELGKSCRVLMDLPGPKLRTGPTQPLPGVIKLRPRRNRLGAMTRPSTIWLTPAEHPEAPPDVADTTLKFPEQWLANLRAGDTINFVDARDRSRSVNVTGTADRSRLAESRRTCYVTSDTIFRALSGREDPGRVGPTARLAELAPEPQSIILRVGDVLVLRKDLDPGKPAVRNDTGAVLEPASISVTLPEIFSDVRPGENIWFDDGKIGGVIRTVSDNEIFVEILKAKRNGTKLRADKGINLPDTELHLPALTREDIARLPFIASHSDLVGYSFVRRPEDVHLLQSELAKVNGSHLGIILKIETRKAFERLPELILAAMLSERIGVMIARGDLAVECGYERTGELQEEIMWIAEAAHVPVIWATQVLENLAQKGQPSRAEISDAALAERAECVMLNKGPYVVEAVQMLDNVLRRMESHQAKKASLMRPLTLAARFCERPAL